MSPCSAALSWSCSTNPPLRSTRSGTGLPAAGHAELREFGNLEDEGEWLPFRGLSADRVPDLVGEIVRQGGRVYAVEPRHETLEDRFLQLLKEQDARESRDPNEQDTRESRDRDVVSP